MSIPKISREFAAGTAFCLLAALLAWAAAGPAVES